MERRLASIAMILVVVLSGCADDRSPASPTPSSPQLSADVPELTPTLAASVSVSGTKLPDDTPAYAFALRLEESGGAPATVSQVLIEFDTAGAVIDPFFGDVSYCDYGAVKLGTTRVPAKGSLAIGPLTCARTDGAEAHDAVVHISYEYGGGRFGAVDVALKSLATLPRSAPPRTANLSGAMTVRTRLPGSSRDMKRLQHHGEWDVDVQAVRGG
jgi:hypothetical protein